MTRFTIAPGLTFTWWDILFFCIPPVLGLVIGVWLAVDLKKLDGPEGEHPQPDTIEAALRRFELRRDAVSTLFALIIYFSVGLAVTVSSGGWPSVQEYMRAHFMDGFGYVLFFALGWRQLERHTERALNLFGLATAAVAAGAAFAAGADWFYMVLIAAVGFVYGQLMWQNITRFTGPAASEARRLLEQLRASAIPNPNNSPELARRRQPASQHELAPEPSPWSTSTPRLTCAPS